MTPLKQRAASRAALGKTLEQGLQPQSSPNAFTEQRCPSDSRFVGLLLDAEHVGAVDELIGLTKSAQAVELVRYWRGHLDRKSEAVQRFPFIVLGGELHRKAGRITGGLAAEWHSALSLFSFVMQRFNEIAEVGSVDFSSAWMMFLTEPRQQQVKALIAEAQECGGSS